MNDKTLLPFLNPELTEQVRQAAVLKEFDAGTEILREQQFVKVLPIVIEGLVKVYSRFNEKELLLYYIEAQQSCVMTFYAALKNTPSKVFATVEEKAKVLLIPVHYLPVWIKQFPEFNEMFFNQFNLRYAELLDTIGHLLLDKMDKRLYDHLEKKISLSTKNSISMSHNQLANELGTAREVITRVLKKLETEGKVAQNKGKIIITSAW